MGFPERRPPGSPKREHKKRASREPRARPGGPIRLKRRRATLPHPLECSTIAAPGLSYRVRNGTGRLNPSRQINPSWRFGNRLADARRKAHRNRIVTTKRSLSPGIEAQERRGTNPP